MRTLDEYRDSQPKRLPNVEHLHAFAREAVRAEALTQDETWDFFLSYIEAAVKNAKALRDAELRKLCDPFLANEEEVRKCRTMIARLDTRIAVYEEVILLPKMLKDAGDKASGLIERMNASTQSPS